MNFILYLLDVFVAKLLYVYKLILNYDNENKCSS